MKSRKNIFISFSFFALTILLSYSPAWVPHYINLFQSEKITILDKISKYRVDCTVEPIGDSICSDQYVIPRSIFPDNVNDPSVGFGQLLVFVRLGCFKNNQFSPIVELSPDKSVNQNYQSLHKSHVVPFTMFDACENEIAIQTWAGKLDARHGAYAGMLTFGNSLSMERMKKLIEYILSSIPQIGGMVAFVIFLLFSKYFSVVGINSQTQSFFSLIPFWFFTFLFTSGLALTLIPVDNHMRVFARVGLYFSLYSHLLVGVYTFKKHTLYPKVAKYLNVWTKSFFEFRNNRFLSAIFTPASIGFVLIVVNPYYSYLFGITSILIALFLMYFCRKDLNVFLFSICYLFAMLKYFNLS